MVVGPLVNIFSLFSLFLLVAPSPFEASYSLGIGIPLHHLFSSCRSSSRLHRTFSPSLLTPTPPVVVPTLFSLSLSLRHWTTLSLASPTPATAAHWSLPSVGLHSRISRRHASLVTASLPYSV
jgi:hypothetical protein